MSVLTIKPCRLEYGVLQEVELDAEGDFLPPSVEWYDGGHCDVVAGETNQRSFDNGITDYAQFVIYLPTASRDYQPGDLIRVTMINGETKELRVKGFRRYQLQCKLWA